jgi:hypothetical protein
MFILANVPRVLDYFSSYYRVAILQHYLHVGQIESNLPEITGIVAQVLETCNENVKSIQSLNTTILEFMYVPNVGDWNGCWKFGPQRTSFSK